MLIGLAGVLLRAPLALVQPALVSGPAECPAAVVVEARVREILGLGAEKELTEHASIEVVDDSLRVVLRGADLQVLGERRLPADGSCEDQAAAVAVLLAAWLSDVHPEFVGDLPDAPAGAAVASPSAGPRDEAPPAPTAAPALVVPLASPPGDRGGPAQPAPSRQPGPRGDVSAGAGGVVSSEAPAPFAALGVRYFPQGSGWGAALGATVTTPRRALLSSGTVRYFRYPLVLGVAYRARAASALVDATLGGAVAWLHVSGVGFQGAASHDAAVWGGAASLRLALPQGRVAPFVELSGLAFQPAEAFVHRGTETPSFSLPNFELYAALGGAFRTW